MLHASLEPDIVFSYMIKINFELYIIIVEVLLLVLHVGRDKFLPVMRHQQILDEFSLLRQLRAMLLYLCLLLLDQIWLNESPIIKY